MLRFLATLSILFFCLCTTLPAVAAPEDKAQIEPSTPAPQEQIGEEARIACEKDPACVALENPIQGGGSLQVIIGRIVKVLLGLLGSLALFMFVDGGFSWLTSAGNPERVKKGAMTMIYSVVGIFVIFAAYGIIGAIIGDLTK